MQHELTYQLDRQETPQQGMRRIILEQVAYVHGLMIDPQPTPEKAVHEARKSFKRIRAALRLVREETGEAWFHRQNRLYRDASRVLAPARDSTVLVLTLDAVAESYAEVVSPASFDPIRRQLAVRHKQIVHDLLVDQDITAVVAQQMEAARAPIDQLPLSSLDFSAFAGGLRRVYKRGRKGMARAYADPADPANFHEWRKRVKYLWHHLDILNGKQPRLLAELAEDLHQLSDYLGDAHDLVQLRKTLLAEPALFAAEANLTTLLALIDRRRRALEEAARPLGRQIYAETPRTFTARLASYWQAWRQETT